MQIPLKSFQVFGKNGRENLMKSVKKTVKWFGNSEKNLQKLRALIGLLYTQMI